MADRPDVLSICRQLVVEHMAQLRGELRDEMRGEVKTQIEEQSKGLLERVDKRC